MRRVSLHWASARVRRLARHTWGYGRHGRFEAWRVGVVEWRVWTDDLPWKWMGTVRGLRYNVRQIFGLATCATTWRVLTNNPTRLGGGGRG